MPAKKKRSASRSPAAKRVADAYRSASPKRRASLTRCVNKCVGKKRKSPKAKGKLPEALQHWHLAIELAGVKGVPRKGTSAHRKVKAIHERLMRGESASSAKRASPKRRSPKKKGKKRSSGK